MFERSRVLRGIDELKAVLDDLKSKHREVTREIELADEIVRLKVEVNDLEIARSKKEEVFDRERRELTHMIGLEKKRQEFEIAAAKREAALVVREENLNAEKVEFERQLRFNTERFEKMETYLKDILGEVLNRLPDVNVEIRKGTKEK